ncbi:MAG: hypothetical protein Q8O64_05690 [Sideroxyarcus sp.]|nr:hypothetical protein [Sideroxyarcus sp.]
MRFNDNLPPVTSAPASNLVPGLSAVHVVKPVRARDPGADQSESQPEHEQSPANTLPQPLPTERRLACRRIHQQKVLIELRSGLDRRRQNLLQGGVADHIDETA